MGKSQFDPAERKLIPWNAGRMVGAKRPLKPRDVWAIHFYLDEHHRRRDRALFGLALDSKLGGCDVAAAPSMTSFFQAASIVPAT